MEKSSKSSKAILKLSKETIEDKVDWTLGNKNRIILGGEEEIIDNVYETEYYGKYLRLYHYRDKHYHDYLEFNWMDSYRLEIVDENDNSLWQFPEDHAIINLYKTVREKTTDVEGFLDSILEDE